MKLRNIIASEKSNLVLGQWDSGKMPKAIFPLSKASGRSYRLGNRRWRSVTFDVANLSCRLLINYSRPLGQYQAMLGVIDGGDTKVIASYERHPDHKGWHVHACCGDLGDVPNGIKRGPWVRSLNSAMRPGQPYLDAMDDDAAYAVARKFFRLDRVPPLDLRA